LKNTAITSIKTYGGFQVFDDPRRDFRTDTCNVCSVVFPRFFGFVYTCNVMSCRRLEFQVCFVMYKPHLRSERGRREKVHPNPLRHILSIGTPHAFATPVPVTERVWSRPLSLYRSFSLLPTSHIVYLLFHTKVVVFSHRGACYEPRVLYYILRHTASTATLSLYSRGNSHPAHIRSRRRPAGPLC